MLIITKPQMSKHGLGLGFNSGKLSKNRKKKTMNPMLEKLRDAPTLERHGSISPAQFEKQWDQPKQPFVLTEAIDEWPARNWTLETFRRRWGHKEFQVDGIPMRLDNLLQAISESTEDNPAPYLRNINVVADFPELLPDIQPTIDLCKFNRLETLLLPQRTLKRGEGRYTQLFIGGAGRSFPNLHWDSPPFHTLSALLAGRKEWILFPPEDTEKLYLKDGVHDVSKVSSFDEVDLQEFPKLLETNPIRVVQEPGEILFVPSYWWHTAKNVEPSISIAWDLLNRTSWKEYSRFIVEARSERKIYAGVLAVYLALVGSVLTVCEKSGIGNV